MFIFIFPMHYFATHRTQKKTDTDSQTMYGSRVYQTTTSTK